MGRGQRCLGWCKEEPWGWESAQGGCKARWAPRAGGEPSLQAEKATLVGRAGDRGMSPAGAWQHRWLGAAPAVQGWGVWGAAGSVSAPSLRVGSPRPAPSLPWCCGSPKAPAGAKGPEAAPDPVAESSFGAPGAGSTKRGRCHRSELAADAVAAQKGPVPGEQLLPLAAGRGRLAKGFQVTLANGESRRRGAEKDAGPGWDLQGGAAPRRAVFGRKQFVSAEPGWSPAPGRCVRGWDGPGSCFLAQTSPPLLTLGTPAGCRAVYIVGGQGVPVSWCLARAGGCHRDGVLGAPWCKANTPGWSLEPGRGVAPSGGSPKQRGFWSTP